jgi:flagellar biosynthesis activator protein FlaF
LNTLELAKNAYSMSAVQIRTPRGVEHEAFAKITQRLISSAKNRHLSYARFVEALHENRKLWLILATDVAGNGNALPPQLRAGIFYLSEFVALHSTKVLNDAADVTPLVEVNNSIMQGLRQMDKAQ